MRCSVIPVSTEEEVETSGVEDEEEVGVLPLQEERETGKRRTRGTSFFMEFSL